MAATAARRQFSNGSTPKCAHCIFVYLCAKIGALIKKCTIGLNIIGKPPHYLGITKLDTGLPDDQDRINAHTCALTQYRRITVTDRQTDLT